MKKLLMLIVVVALGTAVFAQVPTCCPQPPQPNNCIPMPFVQDCVGYNSFNCYLPPTFLGCCLPGCNLPFLCLNPVLVKYNYEFVFQHGNYNRAFQDQVAPGVNALNNNKAFIWQHGSKEYARQYQRGQDNFACIKQLVRDKNRQIYDYALQRQFGTKNDAIIHQFNSQSGNGYYNNQAIQLQGDPRRSATENLAFIKQSMGKKNYARQTQYGSKNDAMIHQSIQIAGGLVLPMFNRAYQTQNGMENKAWTVQSYAYNTATTTQTGNYNHATINQNSGTNNTATVTQTGNCNKVGCFEDIENECCRIKPVDGQFDCFSWGVWQQGNWNNATVTQDSRNDLANEAAVWQVGDRNRAIATQMGHGLTRVQQVGTGNYSVTNQ